MAGQQSAQQERSVSRVCWQRARRTALLCVLGGLLLWSFSERHLWEWCFCHGLPAWHNLRPIRDDRGRQREVWRWANGRRLVVYGQSGVRRKDVAEVAAGVRSLVSAAGEALANGTDGAARHGRPGAASNARGPPQFLGTAGLRAGRRV